MVFSPCIWFCSSVIPNYYTANSAEKQSIPAFYFGSRRIPVWLLNILDFLTIFFLYNKKPLTNLTITFILRNGTRIN